MFFNSWRQWLTSAFPSRSTGRGRRTSPPVRGFRPWLDILEERLTPTPVIGHFYNVTTTADGAGTLTTAPHAGTQADPYQNTTLRGAIASASSGDTIQFASGLAGAIDLSTAEHGLGTLTISLNLTIQGPSNNAITIEGGSTARVTTNAQVFSITSGTVALNNLVISNGYTTGNGGGIYNAGTLTVQNSSITNNTTGSGGGIFTVGTLTVTNSTFANNSSSYVGGGIAQWDGSIVTTVTNSTFYNNSSQYGGGIYHLGNYDPHIVPAAYSTKGL